MKFDEFKLVIRFLALKNRGSLPYHLLVNNSLMSYLIVNYQYYDDWVYRHGQVIKDWWILEQHTDLQRDFFAYIPILLIDLLPKQSSADAKAFYGSLADEFEDDEPFGLTQSSIVDVPFPVIRVLKIALQRLEKIYKDNLSLNIKPGFIEQLENKKCSGAPTTVSVLYQVASKRAYSPDCFPTFFQLQP